MRAKKTPVHTIWDIEPGSIAGELELERGDILLSINDTPVEDIFDYRYLIADEELVLLVQKGSSGEIWELEIEKEYSEDLGIIFENGLMDDYRSCSNRCIFCFIDQLPKGMRDTLYFKDDDSRLSFLQGNYVTLTNMSDHDIDRIIRYHLEPINISFQTMNPSLRCEMLRNRFAGDIFPKVDRLHEAGITMNGQIVLCRHINDGAQLDYSLREMERYVPVLQSVSVVPSGLTKYREGLYPLEPFTKEDARQVLDQIEGWQAYFYQKYGLHFVHPGDEWYLMAQRPFPPEEVYDGYLQLENGVGMMRLLIDECDTCLEKLPGDDRVRHVTIACGMAAGEVLSGIARKVQSKYPHVSCRVIPVKNTFFGDMITVSGLLTGVDLEMALREEELGEELLLTHHMLRSGEHVFLDDMTVEELQEKLGVPIGIVESGGEDLIRAILGKDNQN